MATSLRYDPLDQATIADPYPVYAELREHAPAYWHEQMESWVLTRYRDCREVLRNHEVFARDWRRVGDEVPDHRMQVQFQDPPEQVPLRKLLFDSIGRQDLEGMCRRARVDIEARFEKLADREEFDFMGEIAAPSALEITCELLGVEPPAPATYARVFDGLTRGMDSGLEPARRALGEQAREELVAMMESWFANPRRPGMIADLLDGPAARMPDSYVQNTMSAMFNAGYSTAYASVGSVLLVLMRHPDVVERLRDPSLLETGVDELVRFVSPAQGTSRVATERTTIGDTTIARGEVLVTLFAAANRDPEQFPRPDELILDRSPNQHLGFGWGPHICVGAQVALVWLREFIRCLQDWPATLTLAGEPHYNNTATLRHLEVLPVTFGT
jgi:cytochrome P450